MPVSAHLLLPAQSAQLQMKARNLLKNCGTVRFLHRPNAGPATGPRISERRLYSVPVLTRALTTPIFGSIPYVGYD